MTTETKLPRTLRRFLNGKITPEQILSNGTIDLQGICELCAPPQARYTNFLENDFHTIVYEYQRGAKTTHQRLDIMTARKNVLRTLATVQAAGTLDVLNPLKARVLFDAFERDAGNMTSEQQSELQNVRAMPSGDGVADESKLKSL